MTRQTADPLLAYELLAIDGMPLRVGRTVGRTIYVQTGPEADERDLLIGQMDSADIAEWIVACVNRHAA